MLLHKRFIIVLYPTCFICMLGLFFMVPHPSLAAAKKHKVTKVKGVVSTMTVLAVRPANNDETYVSVIFRISQRIYKLPKDANPKFLELLNESAQNHTPVIITRAKEESDVILGVEKK